jgi:hypothetical protein
MPRHEFDKGSKYLVQQQGKGILWLGGARDVRLCRALSGGERVMIRIESPLISKLLAKTRQGNILIVLTARFGKVPQDIADRLRTVVKDKELMALIRFAAQCPDLAAFRERLVS